jgi:hypothetical protein
MEMHYVKFLLLISLLCSFSFSGEGDSAKTTFNKWGFFTFGKVQSSVYSEGDGVDYDFTNQILNDFDAGLKMTSRFEENGKVRFHVGLTTAYQVLNTKIVSAEAGRRKWVVYLIDAAIEDAIKKGNHSFFGEFGYFPVKYNPEARNLGEYLFRSGTYPGYINSGFELADKEKMIGLHGKYKYAISDKSDFKTDIWFTNECRDFPIHDFTLSYILSVNFAKIVEFGAGLSHAHMISFDKAYVEPGTDTMRMKSSINRQWVQIYDSTSGDTINATFKGTKAMARFSFDPKALFGTTVFGKEDLKLYGEWAFIGMKNYPVYYEKPIERMPVMLGFNVPTFKLLDVLSCEVEYYKSTYINTAENVWLKRSPLPYTNAPSPDSILTSHEDDFKWSIYAAKTIKRFKISGQVASDHILKLSYVPGPPTQGVYREICPRSKDWYWMLRVMYFF